MKSFLHRGLILLSLLNPLLGRTQGHVDFEPLTPATPTTASAAVQAPLLKLPSEFKITERIIGLTSSFKIENGDQLIGNIDKKIFSFGTQFDIKDSSGKKLGHAKQKVFSWGVAIDVFDENERKVGTIKEIISKSWFKVVTEYQILDASGKQIANSEKKDWANTDFTVTDMNGTELLTMSRPMFQLRLSDQWTVKLHNADAIDPRLFLTMSAFKTDRDNARNAISSDSDRKNNRKSK